MYPCCIISILTGQLSFTIFAPVAIFEIRTILSKICQFRIFSHLFHSTHIQQSGTLHFDATNGWSHKIATFCTSQYVLEAEMVYLFVCHGLITRGHHFNESAKLHHSLTYQIACTVQMYLGLDCYHRSITQFVTWNRLAPHVGATTWFSQTLPLD